LIKRLERQRQLNDEYVDLQEVDLQEDEDSSQDNDSDDEADAEFQ
jgi:hypothetical protein